jgi:hypothetical protein
MPNKQKIENLLAQLKRLKVIKESGNIGGILHDLVNEVDNIKGDKGDTPVKGVDYFTPREIEEITQKIIGIVESRIRIPEDGETPVAGVDYPTKAQIEKLVRELVAQIPRIKGDQGDPGKDGNELSEAEIITKLEKDLPKLGTSVRDALELLDGDERLDASAVKDVVGIHIGPNPPDDTDKLWIQV